MFTIKPTPVLIGLIIFMMCISGPSAAAKGGGFGLPKSKVTIEQLDAETAARIAADQLLQNNIDNISLTPGPAGATGPAGAAGTNGIDGIDGLDGLDGLNGVDAPDRTAALCDLYQVLFDGGMIGALAIPEFCSSDPSGPYSVGDTGPAGGIVFYVTDGGLHGLEVSPTDQGTAPWGCLNISLPSTEGNDIGRGVFNTANSIAGCAEAGIAARIANDYSLNGFDDWFLPSLFEILELKIQQAAVGSFPLDSYWISSQTDAEFARLMRFSSEIDFIATTKDRLLGVRAIRAF